MEVTTLRRIDEVRVWLRRHPNWLIVLMLIGVSVAIVQSFRASEGQSSRATAAAQKVVDRERTDRQNSELAQAGQIHAIAVVAHKTLLRSCLRGKGLRIAVRKNALAGRERDRAFAKFLDVYAGRARVTLADPTATAAVKQAAQSGIDQIDALEAGLDLNPTIPPPPADCSDPDVVPTIAEFEATAQAATSDGK